MEQYGLVHASYVNSLKLHLRLHIYRYQDRSRSVYKVAPAPDRPRDHHGFRWRFHLQISASRKLP